MLAIISVCVNLALFVLSLVFKVAGKLRLGLPLLYTVFVCTVFHSWSAANPFLSNGILIGLLALTVLSWVISLIHVVRDRLGERKLENQIRLGIQYSRLTGKPFSLYDI